MTSSTRRGRGRAAAMCVLHGHVIKGAIGACTRPGCHYERTHA